MQPRLPEAQAVWDALGAWCSTPEARSHPPAVGGVTDATFPPQGPWNRAVPPADEMTWPFPIFLREPST